MSIFFDFEVGISGRRFRKAVDEDKCDVERLINLESTEKLFNTADIGSLIELSNLSICLINESKRVTGFMALCDHPNVPGVDPAGWEVWIRNMFQKYYLSRNTLFVHLMCCEDSVTDFFIEEAFESIFRNDDYLLNIVIVVPTGCPKNWISRYSAFKKRNVYKFKSKATSDSENLMYLYTAMRNDFRPKLRIRRAVEEDNDDIVEILAKNTPRLHDLYGNFYISEIIGRRTETDRKILVADHQHRAVGVMCLNSDLNYEMLHNTYELSSLHGLKKATPIEKEKYKRTNTLLQTIGDPIMIGHWSPFSGENTAKTKKPKMKPSKKYQSKVNFEHKSTKEIGDYKTLNSEDYSENELHFVTDSIETTRSVIDLLDEDPFDYEIINIDKQLFDVPEALSYNYVLPSPERLNSKELRNTETQVPINRRISILQASNEEIKLLNYSGDPNAFMIELFGFREGFDDRHGFHLLQAAFELMKDYDYCVIRVPYSYKNFHLLQHFCVIPTKDKTTSEYALYVAHRSSVIGKLRVRKAELMDIPQICHVLRSLDSKETLWTLEDTILCKNQLKCYVFLSGTALVGVGILEKPQQIDYVRAKFNLDSHRIHKYYLGEGLYCGIFTLKAVLIYPVFEPHYRFFANEMMRLSGSYSLIWLTKYRNKWATEQANSLVGAMIPLVPRKSQIDWNSTRAMQRIQQKSNYEISFSSWFISKKFTSVPQVNVDTRIVIIGASRTAMAFLNSLLFSDSCTYLRFTNVTLVSPNGLSYNRRTKPINEMMFPKFHTTSENYLKSVPYTYYVNIIRGTVVDINKRAKYITLTNKGRCYYDLLFLLCGKQYQHPNYLKSVFRQDHKFRRDQLTKYTSLDVLRSQAKPIFNQTPVNVFIVNTLADANIALNFVKTLSWSDIESKIIVYGGTIHAYCCLAALVEMKVPAENIVFVEPFPNENPNKTRVSIFCNSYVDKATMEVLNNLKIQIYRSFYYTNWITDSDNFVSRVDFLSYHHLLRLKCNVFFYYGVRGINEQAFSAINNTGIVYDGGILIDHQFRTKDPSIYAAGPVTRYNRIYHADHKRLKYYDAEEVGSVLGSQIRNQLDPLFSKGEGDSRQRTEILTNSFQNRHSLHNEILPKVPNFTKPHVVFCTLPGGLQYMDVQSPGKKTPHQYLQSLGYNGIVLETFKNGYFRLHLTNDYVVDGITCLTLEKYAIENFKHLYGLSSTTLNHVHLRFTAKKIENFYDFFRLPWASFIYHDQRDELLAMVKELLPKRLSEGDNLLTEAYQIEESKQSDLKFHAKLKIKSSLQASPHIQAITDYVTEWLSQDEILLPMYVQPWQVTMYDWDVKHHPAFVNKKKSYSKMLANVF